MTSMTDGRARSRALGVLCIALVAIATAYASAFVVPGGASWSVPAFILGMCLASGAMMALGAAKGGRLGVLLVPIGLTIAIVVAGLLLAWGLPAENEPLWLGLPRRAAIVIYGVALLPMFVLPVAYALTFDRVTLRPEDIVAVRAARAEMMRERGSEPGPPE
ncbi:MAG: hypothetical protein ACR2HZ_06945 [Gemmatimonadaceae bacterium]